jgi:hypothetical protein
VRYAFGRMKKLLQVSAIGLAFVAVSPSAPAADFGGDSEEPRIELACKPRGTTCHTSFECCSQNCQTVNGKDACH